MRHRDAEGGDFKGEGTHHSWHGHPETRVINAQAAWTTVSPGPWGREQHFDLKARGQLCCSRGL